MNWLQTLHHIYSDRTNHAAHLNINGVICHLSVVSCPSVRPLTTDKNDPKCYLYTFMRTRFFAAIIIILSSYLYAQQPPPQTNWDEWLQNEGFYLLSSEQKKVFKQMPEPQKESYIKSIWASM